MSDAPMRSESVDRGPLNLTIAALREPRTTIEGLETLATDNLLADWSRAERMMLIHDARLAHELRAALLDAAERCAFLERALTPSTDTKSAYMGDFSFDGPEGMVTVPWTTIKEFMEAVQHHAAYLRSKSASDAGQEKTQP